MRVIAVVLAVVVLAVLGGALFFRVVPMPAARWHVSPADVIPPTRPNYELRRGADAPFLPAPPGVIAARLADLARSERAEQIAGSPDTGHVTYVARSALMGFPDAISVSLIPEGEGTRVEIFSRSRFGYSDLGVNAARVARWIAALAAQSGP